ncbi:MAG: GTPase Era [Clostridiales bacterium]
MTFKSGFVSIIGKPNVGKSTLLNILTKEKVAITSKKPQTTRNTIKSVVTTDDCQIIFMDTPGIHKPRNELGKYMVGKAEDSIKEVDAVLFVVEVLNKKLTTIELNIVEILKKLKVPKILIINKIDLVKNKEEILIMIDEYNKLMDYDYVIPVSAINEEGLNQVMESVKNILPEGPKYFPDDTLTDQPEKQIMAEVIREKSFNLLSDEIPYGIGVEIISFKDEKEGEILSIQANLYCEKNSHKGIIIGKKGSMLKSIGTEARKEMENLMGTKVYLELWVKVKIDWRNNKNMLKNLGYN